MNSFIILRNLNFKSGSNLWIGENFHLIIMNKIYRRIGTRRYGTRQNGNKTKKESSHIHVWKARVRSQNEN